MAKSNSSSQKLNRCSDMDAALFEALASAVPDKNTGPDPDDILGDVLAQEADASSLQQGEGRNIVVALDVIDIGRAEQIVELVRRQSGEQVDMAQAIKVALSLCTMDEEVIGAAYAGITAGKSVD